MYVIRRTYKVKPGQARNAALLLREVADITLKQAKGLKVLFTITEDLCLAQMKN